jgi:DNA-directed RNA polymerase subunit K
MLEKFQGKFTKYEIARILGARSLQLAMDAPILLKFTKEDENEINFNTLKIAEKELEANVLPITVRRPLPKKSGKTIKKLSDEEIKERLNKQEKMEVREEKVKKEVETEEKEEKEIEEEGEIMEMVTPEDEAFEEGESEGEEEL